MLDAHGLDCPSLALRQEWVTGMRLQTLIPVLDVKDVDTSIEFYCDVLGFTLHDKVQWAGRTEWAVLRSDDVQLMLCASQGDDDEDRSGLSEGVFFLYHDNLESLLLYLGSKGYDSRSSLLQVSPSARDFYLRDPDGYVLWFSHKPLGQT